MEDSLEFWGAADAGLSIVSKVEGPPGRRSGQVVRSTKTIGDVAEGSIGIILCYLAEIPYPPVRTDSSPEYVYRLERQVLFCNAWERDGSLSCSEIPQADCLEPCTETPPWAPFAVDERGHPVDRSEERAQVEKTRGEGRQVEVRRAKHCLWIS